MTVLGGGAPEAIAARAGRWLDENPRAATAAAVVMDAFITIRGIARYHGVEHRMQNHRIFTMSFASVYPLYVQKAEKKGRKREEVDQVICWMSGYSAKTLAEQIERKTDLETFFSEAPALNPNIGKITGVICGVRIEEIEDPLMRNIRCLDKLVDELAKGRPMEKILRK